MKSWNLSAIWRLRTTAGPMWLKAVPPFLAHEGAVIDWIGPRVGPRLHGHARGRALMAQAPGEPNHGVTGDALRPMVELLTTLQERAVGATAELAGLGVPDRRLPLLVPRIEEVAGRGSVAMDAGERRALEALVADLPRRAAAIESCGVPDTLVHGDFHPGNAQGRPGGYVLLDWGDSFVGNPLVDELAFVRHLRRADRGTARQWFVDAWRRIAPSADPEQAARLLAPVLPLIAAVTYHDFCAAIEPDERVYHQADVGRMLRQAVADAGAQPA